VRNIRTLLVALLFLALAATYWKIDVLAAATGIVTPFSSEDLYTLYYPLIHFGIESMKDLHIPLWNPYQALGVPFLGSALFGLFSPFSFLYYILPTHLAMGWSTVMNIALAGLFTFIFLHRGLRLQTPGAVTGSLVFMFSGPLLLEIIHPSLLGAMAFLPLLLFLTGKVFETGSPRWTVLFALILACQMLTGAVQIVVHTVFMVAAYGAVLVYLRWREGGAMARPLILLLAGGIIAIALSSLQWLPLWELSGHTGRDASGLSLKDVEPFRTYFTPWVVTKAILLGGRGVSIGFIPVLLGPLAFLGPNRAKRPYKVFFAITAVLTLLMAFGTHTPLYGIYYHYLPTGKMFRVPVRWLWLTAFSVAMLAAMGAESIFNRLEGRKMARRGVVIIIPLVITVFLFDKNIMRLYNHPQNTPEIFTRHSAEGAFLRKKQGAYRTYITSDFVNDYSLLEKFGTLEKVFVLNDYESLSTSAYKRFIGTILGDRNILGKKIFYGAYQLGGNRRHLRLMSLLSVGFIMEKGTNFFTRRRPPGIGEIYNRNGVRIYRYRGALPRAYIVYRSETIRDEKAALERLTSPSFNPRSAVVLERDAGLGRRHAPRLTRARITRLAPERIEMVVHPDQKGVLVLTDLYYPGWRAYVDGEERPILRANTIMRGVILEKGAHRVVFDYKPLPFRVGLWTSLLTLAGIVAYLGVDVSRKKRRGRET